MQWLDCGLTKGINLMKILQGIDLLKINRIERIYLNYRDRFLEKILTNREIKQIKNHRQICNKIASKFSAKEAASKALGTGFANGVKIKDIEILNLKSGKPIINLYGKAKTQIKNIQSSSVSISDEDGFVISIVTFLVEKK
jgi:holo-[acyl-carrier protein] synthase